MDYHYDNFLFSNHSKLSYQSLFKFSPVSFNMFPPYLEHFFTFWNMEIVQNRPVLSFSHPWNQTFLQGVLVSFIWENQDLSQGEFLATWIVLLLGPLSGQVLVICKVCSRTHIETSLFSYILIMYKSIYHHDFMLIPVIPLTLR